jgi:hypothetical protein
MADIGRKLSGIHRASVLIENLYGKTELGVMADFPDRRDPFGRYLTPSEFSNLKNSLKSCDSSISIIHESQILGMVKTIRC